MFEPGRPRAADAPKENRERIQVSGAGSVSDALWGARAAFGRAFDVEREDGSALVHRLAGLGRLRLAGAVGGLCRAADVAPAGRPAERRADAAALVRSNAEGFRSRYSRLVFNVAQDL